MPNNITETYYPVLLEKSVLRIKRGKMTVQQFKSLHVLLFRHHKKYIEELDRFGFLGDNLAGTTVKYRLEEEVAVFEIAAKRSLPVFEIIYDEQTETQEFSPPRETLHSDLAADQESQVWDGSSYPCPPNDGEDSDPSSPEGEIYRGSTDEEDWRTLGGAA